MASKGRDGWKGDAILAAGLGAGTLALDLATLARVHPPDAARYAADVEAGQILHPQHLLHNAMGWLAVTAAARLAPQAAPMTALQVLDALIGAAGVAILTGLVARAGGRRSMAAAAGLSLALSYGWWSLSVTYEVHVAPVVLLLALGSLLARRRPVAGATAGLLHAAAIVLHKTAVLAGPGVLLALLLLPGTRGARLRRAGVYLGTGVAAVGAAYLLAVSLPLGPSLPPPLASLIMGEVPHGMPPVPEEGRFRGGVRAWRRVLVYTGAPRCGFVDPRFGDQDASGILGHYRAARRLGTAVLAGAWILVLAAAPWTAPRHRALGAMLAAWMAVALPLIGWFEADNYEYYVGPSALLLAWTALSAGALLDRVRRRRLRRSLVVLVAMAWTAVAAAMGWQSYCADIGPASSVEGPHRSCQEHIARHPRR